MTLCKNGVNLQINQAISRRKFYETRNKTTLNCSSDGDSEDDGDVETDDDGPAPNTGDKEMPFAMALLMVLSVLGIVALTVFGRKRKV